MSLAGRPKTIARKQRESAIAKARAEYRQAIEPIDKEFARRRAEAIAPHQDALLSQLHKADLAYFEAIDDKESARLLKERAA